MHISIYIENCKKVKARQIICIKTFNSLKFEPTHDFFCGWNNNFSRILKFEGYNMKVFSSMLLIYTFGESIYNSQIIKIKVELCYNIFLVLTYSYIQQFFQNQKLIYIQFYNSFFTQNNNELRRNNNIAINNCYQYITFQEIFLFPNYFKEFFILHQISIFQSTFLAFYIQLKNQIQIFHSTKLRKQQQQ
eukprot:TRINITY_DN9810_c0_g3_i1.p3 TRINITY_DN9810_c0_g3~~TRINITY_DN9810_c0_g3_i1.p3  ORF type:complete len:190 (+),score=-13.39 TRINITY_DN9810_c0_g3_i1:289-858(+)